ncbi:MAG: histidinol dehydrogenase [Candidatus Marinimicrobia bacterium]|nr:histidinol dehydrogenase [Candidatus Neomarinimicrobiota bacterium]
MWKRRSRKTTSRTTRAQGCAARALERGAAARYAKRLMDVLLAPNHYAPGHLIIQTIDAEKLTGKVSSAGSVFIGPYTPESAGDYASGTNHTLPTNAVCTELQRGFRPHSYMKMITFQKILGKRAPRNRPPRWRTWRMRRA